MKLPSFLKKDKTKKILVYDDNSEHINKIIKEISGDFHICAKSHILNTLISRNKYDVAIINKDLFNASGLDLGDTLKKIKSKRSSSSVIVYNMDPKPNKVIACIEEGADLAYCKKLPIERLINEIQKIFNNSKLRSKDWYKSQCVRMALSQLDEQTELS